MQNWLRSIIYWLMEADALLRIFFFKIADLIIELSARRPSLSLYIWMGQISPFEWAKLVLDLHYSDSISSLILVGRPRGRAMSPDTSSQSWNFLFASICIWVHPWTPAPSICKASDRSSTRRSISCSLFFCLFSLDWVQQQNAIAFLLFSCHYASPIPSPIEEAHNTRILPRRREER
jgi:hypothetical protein